MLLASLLPALVLASALTPHGAGGAGRIHGAAFHPHDPEVMLIAPDTYGICRSDDAGESWYIWNRGLANIDNA
ncbi:MAG: hypothetical protein QF492_07995 [Candidatus Krumholzibacteria bacterium]|nr:hypothetical protein [Candidatus Krumholzibacteria bacterium]